MSYRVAPIDIDPVGWCEVPETEANAWGVIDSADCLVVARKTREAAEQKLEEVAKGNP